MDVEIPIAPCDKGSDTSQDVDYLLWAKGNKYLCPAFNESHFIHGGFSADKYSWLRLAIHLCDDREEARLEKIARGQTHVDCASREESLKFFEQNIIGFETWSKVASTDQEFSKNLYKSDDVRANGTK